MLIEIGRSDAAQEDAARAISLDPLNPYAFTWQTVVLFLARRYPSAVAAARRALALNPSGSIARSYLVYSLIMMGQNDQARAELAKLPADSWGALSARAIIAARTGDRTGSDRLLHQLHRDWGDSANNLFAMIYAQRGDADTAIGYLNKPIAQRSARVQYIAADPFLDPIRGDPRFKEIIRGLDLPV